jgi:DNA-binding response OmpR family regulator
MACLAAKAISGIFSVDFGSIEVSMKAQPNSKSTQQTTVFLAGGDSATRRQLTELLRGKYKVSSANTSAEALDAVKRNEPDVVIVGLTASDKNGLEFLKQLREVSRNSAVIVLTTRSRTSDIPNALELGANDFLVKPIDNVEFEERINRAVIAANQTTSGTVHIKILLPQLHDPKTGRIAADKVAAHLAIPLKQLAHAVGANYATVHKTPAADSLQSALIPVKRSLEILHELLRDPAAEKAWLNTPHPDLGKRTPLQVILEGNGNALWTILENALEGIPS